MNAGLKTLHAPQRAIRILEPIEVRMGAKSAAFLPADSFEGLDLDVTIRFAGGASMANTVVIDGGQIVNPEGLRYEDEFVRHKLLDAIGDLALAGAPICGRFVADQPGHALNARLVRALLDTPEAWRWDGDEGRRE